MKTRHLFLRQVFLFSYLFHTAHYFQTIARSLDEFASQSKSTTHQPRGFWEYVKAPVEELKDSQRWKDANTVALMAAAHFVFRHALLDRIIYSSIDNIQNPVQLVPRCQLPHGPKKFSEVRLVFLNGAVAGI